MSQPADAGEVGRRGAVGHPGAVFPLNWSADLPDPPMFGRGQHTHEVIDRSTGHDDVLHNWNTQSSSQWDGFRHIKNLPNGFYDGVPDEEHGVDHWARRGIAGRAVLCDVGRWRAAQGGHCSTPSPT